MTTVPGKRWGTLLEVIPYGDEIMVIVTGPGPLSRPGPASVMIPLDREGIEALRDALDFWLKPEPPTEAA